DAVARGNGSSQSWRHRCRRPGQEAIPHPGTLILLPGAPRVLLPGATARLAKDLPSAIIRPSASSEPLPCPARSPQGPLCPAALPGATELLLPGATPSVRRSAELHGSLPDSGCTTPALPPSLLKCRRDRLRHLLLGDVFGQR